MHSSESCEVTTSSSDWCKQHVEECMVTCCCTLALSSHRVSQRAEQALAGKTFGVGICIYMTNVMV
jgi:hypothetical protein